MAAGFPAGRRAFLQRRYMRELAADLRWRRAVRVLIVRAVLLALALLAIGAAVALADDLDHWRDCLQAAAARLDDRISDARTIAAAAYTTCLPERLRVVAERSRAIPNVKAGEVERAVDQLRAQDIDYASIIVLGLRAKR